MERHVSLLVLELCSGFTLGCGKYFFNSLIQLSKVGKKISGYRSLGEV